MSYLGFGGGVSVEIPEPGATDLTATDLSLFGIWLERRPSEGLVGGGIGYRDRRSVVAPPECRIVIFAETDAQLAQAEAMARDLTADGEGICVSGL